MTKRSKGEFDELRPLVPPGWYEMRFVSWRTYMYLDRQPKVEWLLSITTFGPHFDTIVSRFYNARKLKGRARTEGQFAAGRSSDLLRTFAQLVPVPIRRLDRIPMTRLRPLLLKGRVENVTKDRNQKPLANSLIYSRVVDLELADR
jgi:hypothetical protein